MEIWDQKKQNKIETLQTSSDGRVLCIALDGNEDLLVIGTSDGRIQVKKKKNLQSPGFVEWFFQSTKQFFEKFA